MSIRLFLVCSCFLRLVSTSEDELCLTGYMTDIQSWVDRYGALKVTKEDVEKAVDLSGQVNPVPELHQTLLSIRNPSKYVKYLSFARCQLNRVPPVFTLQDARGRNLTETLEYLTFYGNEFVAVSKAGDQYNSWLNATNTTQTLSTDITNFDTLWSAGFDQAFSRLKELDLRACSIQILSIKVFRGMKRLEALYLGENKIHLIERQAFVGLRNLRHLDLSLNQGYNDEGQPRNLATNSYNIFEGLQKLESLDLSSTKLSVQNLGMVTTFGNTLRSLSLCKTGLKNLTDNTFNETSLQVLDISWNSGILLSPKALSGVENTLTVLYAKNIGLRNVDLFQNFHTLEILLLSYNEITAFPPSTAKTLSNLKVLDLTKNRITAWFDSTFSLIPTMTYLSLKDNNINVISQELIDDIKNIDYVALSRNFIICNCLAKDFYKMAFMNEKYNDTYISVIKNIPYNKAFDEYNALIRTRMKIDYDCNEQCYQDIVGDIGKFRLVDYSDDAYMCLLLDESRSVSFEDVDSCRKSAREIIDTELAHSQNKLLALLVIPCILLPMLIVFVFRRHFRYCYITMRNSAMLSLINKNEAIEDGAIFNYDVFVSYCNEDRGWVLDFLLPQLESDCTISACLHERDFQVGLSILENIVSCMDRSRSIMLIISQRFLLSQWCQFEMHLAQHRLLETRREDLTLVLLEEIPRRMRPNTLHYLMLTKTYIVWPKGQTDRILFWRRLKKSLITTRNNHSERTSLA